MTHAQAPSTEEHMLGRQAKIVSPATLRRMLAYARQARQPKRDTVIVLLSVKAGLRACEIAGLQWSMVMTDNGKIGDVIDIRDTIAKRGSGRRIPMHPDLQRALAALWRVRTSDQCIAASNRGGPMRANSIQYWQTKLEEACVGCFAPQISGWNDSDGELALVFAQEHGAGRGKQELAAGTLTPSILVRIHVPQPGIPFFFSGASPLARVRQAETAAA
jgi:hypothetical protein